MADDDSPKGKRVSVSLDHLLGDDDDEELSSSKQPDSSAKTRSQPPSFAVSTSAGSVAAPTTASPKPDIDISAGPMTVSYTHLTLPTICSV